MPEITLNNIKVYYEIHGHGEPLILIAGLASDSQSWMPLLGDLAKEFRVIVFDNRGVGRTTPQDCPISIQLMADDTALLLKGLGVNSCSVLGHSMGGFIAADLAIRYPGCVDKLILAGSAPFNSPRNNSLFSDWVYLLESGIDLDYWVKNIFYWIFTEDFFRDPKLLQDTLNYVKDYPYPQSKEGFRAQVEAIRGFNCLSNLSQIRSKTLLLYGSEELLFDPRESEGLFSALSDKTTRIIDHSAHSIHLERPKEFVECVIKFLRG